MSSTITVEELFAEFERLKPRPDGTFTVAEMKERTGRGTSWVRDRVRMMKNAGLVTVADFEIMGMNDRPQTVRGYRFVGKPKGKK